MRIAKPYTAEDKMSKVLFDGQDVTDITLACDDEEGWVELLTLFSVTPEGRRRFLVHKYREGGAVTHRVHGKVVIVRSVPS